jgi:hypothetical protein
MKEACRVRGDDVTDDLGQGVSGGFPEEDLELSCWG